MIVILAVLLIMLYPTTFMCGFLFGHGNIAVMSNRQSVSKKETVAPKKEEEAPSTVMINEFFNELLNFGGEK